MAKSPDQIVAEIDRRQNEEDKELIPRAGRALLGAADSVGQTIRGAAGKAFKAGKDFGSKIAGNDTDQAKLKRMGLREGSEDYELGLKTLENNKKKLPSELTKKHPLEMKSGGKIKDPTMTYQSYSKTGKPAGMKTVTVKKASGGSVSSASKRADGCAIKGKTKGRMV